MRGVKKKPGVPALLEQKIHLIRGHKVMLDRDLAYLYGVPAIALRQQVRRNKERFPEDFMLRLTKDEAENLVSQSVIPSRRSFGGSLPLAFTQEGIAMLSSVLRSKRAVQMNIAIMRAFVRLREMLAAHKDLAARIEKLEAGHGQHASIITLLAQEIRALKILPDPPPRHPIGFRIRKKDQ
jgi:ORF6N domain